MKQYIKHPCNKYFGALSVSDLIEAPTAQLIKEIITNYNNCKDTSPVQEYTLNINNVNTLYRIQIKYSYEVGTLHVLCIDCRHLAYRDTTWLDKKYDAEIKLPKVSSYDDILKHQLNSILKILKPFLKKKLTKQK